jgi:glycosyltransferase involved in cell wall biosynthesis
VSDDGSKDDTLAILKGYQADWGNGRLTIYSGPGKGFVANFLSLACNPAIEADYFAFSDQDDIWESDKLQRAVNWLNSVPVGVPALYSSRTKLIDAVGADLGCSPLFQKAPSFVNALVQSIGGANTMVFNQAACKLLQEAGESVDVSSHDCWAYLVISACGGVVHHDTYPSVRYRQHGNNIVGANVGLPAMFRRAKMLSNGYLKDYADRNIAALQKLRPRMTLENQQRIDVFSRSRNSWLLPRLVGFWQTGIYRQSLLGNLGLAAAAIFRKI